MSHSEAPSWFRRALATPYRDCEVDVDGTPIHNLAWGEPGRPGLVFVHGGAAHAHWWTHIAPQFSQDYRVVALDLSGHGDSGRRQTYPMRGWTNEIIAVADDADMAGPPVVIGHSMGGFVTFATAALHREQVAGAMIIDSPAQREDPEVEAARMGTDFRAPKTYTDRDAMMARFRTVPEQDNYLSYVMDHVARWSIATVEDGFTWKFDSRVFSARRAEIAELLPQIECRVALFRAEHGLVSEEIGAFMYDQLGRVAPVIEIPEAGHHVMLDQPLLLVTGVRSLLADWNHSTPLARRSN